MTAGSAVFLHIRDFGEKLFRGKIFFQSQGPRQIRVGGPESGDKSSLFFLAAELKQGFRQSADFRSGRLRYFSQIRLRYDPVVRAVTRTHADDTIAPALEPATCAGARPRAVSACSIPVCA